MHYNTEALTRLIFAANCVFPSFACIMLLSLLQSFVVDSLTLSLSLSLSFFFLNAFCERELRTACVHIHTEHLKLLQTNVNVTCFVFFFILTLGSIFVASISHVHNTHTFQTGDTNSSNSRTNNSDDTPISI